MLAISTYPLNRINLMRMTERLRNLSHPVGLEFFFDELPSNHAYYYQFRMEQLIETNLISMHGPCEGCDPLADEETLLWQHTLEQHKRCFHLASQLGIRHVVFHPNTTNPIEPLMKEAMMERLENRLTFFELLAQEYGLILRVENVGFAYNNSLLLDQADFIELFFKHPRIQALLDIGHAHVNHWEIPMVIATLGNRITGYHLHDNDQTADAHLPIGCGTISWSNLWHAIATFTPLADLTVEYGKTCAEEQMIADCLRLPGRLAFETKK